MNLEYRQRYVEQGGRVRNIRVSCSCEYVPEYEGGPQFLIPRFETLIIVDENERIFSDHEFVLDHAYDEDWWEETFYRPLADKVINQQLN